MPDFYLILLAPDHAEDTPWTRETGVYYTLRAVGAALTEEDGVELHSVRHVCADGTHRDVTDEALEAFVQEYGGTDRSEIERLAVNHPPVFIGELGDALATYAETLPRSDDDTAARHADFQRDERKYESEAA